jgi:hypothetical protein
MTRSEYMECLGELLVALVEVHGPLTVRAAHELANQAILSFGIDNAAAAIRGAHRG